MAQKHTPTPWGWSLRSPWREGPFGKEYAVVIGADGTVVVNGVSPGGDDGKRNAAFIVKACNSYERLLEAAKPALELLDALWGEQWLEHGEAESDPTIEHLRDTIDYAAVEQETVPV